MSEQRELHIMSIIEAINYELHYNTDDSLKRLRYKREKNTNNQEKLCKNKTKSSQVQKPLAINCHFQFKSIAPH